MENRDALNLNAGLVAMSGDSTIDTRHAILNTGTLTATFDDPSVEALISVFGPSIGSFTLSQLHVRAQFL